MVGKWPRYTDYNQAFHTPEAGLIPNELKRATVARNGFGSPDPLSGGFAYIYRLTFPDGKQKAVRVFMQEDPIRDKRLPWVLDRLHHMKLLHPSLQDVFLDCQWIDPCIRTPLGDVPAMVMDWGEGLTLGEWLRKHKGDSESILKFRQRFFRMMEQLEQAKIAHGDLQMGNILVTRKGRPLLVDYDGVAFFDEPEPPPIQGGHPNFQHPKRSNTLPGSHLDRFPALAIDMGLAAWALFSEADWFLPLVSDADCLYFSRSDFLDPEHSEAFGRLRGDPQLGIAVKELETLCKGDPLQMPTLAEFRSRAFPTEIEATSRYTQTGKAPTAEQPGKETMGRRRSGKKTRKPEGPFSPREWKEKEAEYIPVFPLFDALDVQGLSSKVGKMVEVIGKITEIHEGETKYGDPYVFVNFMDWRESEVFHLVAWSEDLDELVDPPSEEWVGKWIHVTGLLEEPYIRKSYRSGRTEQVRYSIRLRNDQQFRFLGLKKASARLKAASSSSFSSKTVSAWTSSALNAPALSTPYYKSKPIPSKVESSSPKPSASFLDPSRPSNQELLKQLQPLTSTPSNRTDLSSSGRGSSSQDSRTKIPFTFLLLLIGFVLFLLHIVSR